jgi:1-acyl-sn-glycerol-3-phosphate acyltransferase
MTPPDRQKRPSARPSARAAEKPESSGRAEPVKADDAPKGEAVAGGRESPAPDATNATKRKHPKKQRIAARRSTAPEPSHSVPPTEAFADTSSRTQTLEVRSAHPAEQSTPVARPTAPAKPTRRSTARGQGSVPAQARVPADLSDVAEEDDEHDVFGEGTAAGLTAVVTEAASEPSAEPPTRAFNRLTKSSRDEKRQREEAVLLSQSRELLGTDYYFRQYGAHGIRSLSAEVDDFGLDPHFEERARPLLEAMVKRYFRVDVDGARHIPAQGRALMVANRAGALPWDGMVLRTAMRMTRPELSPVRWLAEDSIFHYPFLGVFMNRLGAVRACPENAERLLEQDRLVAVFPEGAHGSSKLFKERYRLQRFGRGGYVKLALKHGAPVIPTAIIGAEETNPLLGRARPLARALGASYLPITPTFPWLGPVGLLPAPVKWRIVVGEPIDLSSYGPEAAEDALVVHRLNDQIRSTLQALVEQARGSRRSVLFG